MAIHHRHRVAWPFVSPYAYIMQLTHEYIQRERTISWEPPTSFVLNIKKTWRKVESSRGRVGCFPLYVLIWNHPSEPRDTSWANCVASQHSKLATVIMSNKIYISSVGREKLYLVACSTHSPGKWHWHHADTHQVTQSTRSCGTLWGSAQRRPLQCLQIKASPSETLGETDSCLNYQCSAEHKRIPVAHRDLQLQAGRHWPEPQPPNLSHRTSAAPNELFIRYSIITSGRVLWAAGLASLRRPNKSAAVFPANSAHSTRVCCLFAEHRGANLSSEAP